jgi:hypothetical protein
VAFMAGSTIFRLGCAMVLAEFRALTKLWLVASCSQVVHSVFLLGRL